ncbi:hypothetical protein PBI_GRETELLYN_45 [Gordonia phage GretelLyn]|uniref:Uncharacterized protein n=2 Tax=Lambovirus sadboi TaxID=2844674 RepID=A0A5J6TCR1_9CAUD|nr:membrane protein [Gordonia phage Sadboi]QFG08184.1 hypothetical protein PBI_GRETELLYN_45 [Gordonia phage GretelLyn]QFG14696.1 hypothetical protein PBI_SADBOI_46 [Gordonia phage Sadboi]
MPYEPSAISQGLGIFAFIILVVVAGWTWEKISSYVLQTRGTRERIGK